MSDNSFTFNIAKLPTLTGQDNYRIWAASWCISFDAADYWEVVCREFAKPTPLTAAQKAKKAEEDDDESEEDNGTKWKRINKRALALLLQAVSVDLQETVINESSVASAWKALRDRFD